MISHKYFEEYVHFWENGQINLNEERIKLINIIKSDVLIRDDIYFNDKLIDKYIRFAEKNFFPLAKYQKLLRLLFFFMIKKIMRCFLMNFLLL